MNTAAMTNALLDAGWTQTAIAEFCGVRQPTVSRWRNGQDPEGPSRDKLKQLYDDVVGVQAPGNELAAARKRAIAAFDELDPSLVPTAIEFVETLKRLKPR